MAEDGSTRDFGTSPPPQHYSPLPVLTCRTFVRDREEEDGRSTILPPIYDEFPTTDMPAAPILSSSEFTSLDVNGSSLPLLDSRSGKRPRQQPTNKDVFPPQKTLHSKYQTPLLPLIAVDDKSRVDLVPPPSPKAYTTKKRKIRRKQERKRLPDVPPMTITSVGPTERRAFKTEVPPLTPSDSFLRWWTRARTTVHGRPLPAPSSPTPGEIALKRHLLDRHPDPPQTAPPDVNFYLGTGEGAREIDPVEFWKRKLVARTKQMGRDLTAGVRYWTRFPMNKARSFPRKEAVGLLTP